MSGTRMSRQFHVRRTPVRTLQVKQVHLAAGPSSRHHGRGRDAEVAPEGFEVDGLAGQRDARLIEVDDCGHLASLEQPEEVNQAFEDWLAPEL